MSQLSAQFSRRDFLKFAVASTGLAAVSALQACAPVAAPQGTTGAAVEEAGSAPADEPVTISWYEWSPAIDKLIADNTIASFEAEHPNIKILLEQSAGNHYDKLQTALAGGTAADVINTQTWLFQSFAAKGAFAPLDEYREQDNYNDPFPEEWADVYEAQTQFRGNLYGIPWNMNSMIMFYSLKPFDDAGLDYPTDDWTFDEFVELTRQLTREVDGVQQFGYQTNTSYERLACWMRLNGDKEWDQEVEPREARWDQDYIIDMINFQLYEVLNDHKVSPTPAMMQSGTNQLQTGNVAMKMEGPWFFPQMGCGEWECGEQDLSDGSQTTFDVVQLPLSPDGKRAHMVFGHVLVMNAASEKKEAAWEMLKFAGGETAQKHVAEAGRGPVTPELMRDFWAPKARETWGLQNTDAFIKAYETGILHLAGEIDDRFITQEVYGPARDKMVAGEATAHELVPEMNRQIQEILDNYWAEEES